MRSLLNNAGPQEGNVLTRALKKTTRMIIAQPEVLVEHFPKHFQQHQYWQENPRKAEKLISGLQPEDEWTMRGGHICSFADLLAHSNATMYHCPADVIEIWACGHCGRLGKVGS